MENILVIGNGFDIAHKLNTRYENFIEFYQIVASVYKSFNETQFEYNDKYLKQLKNELDRYFIKKSVSQKAVTYFSTLTLDSESYHVLQLCRTNYWLDYIQKNKNDFDEKWSDFEYMIAKQIEILAYMSNHIQWNCDDKTMMNTKYSTQLVELFHLITNDKVKNNYDFQLQMNCFKKRLIDELNHLIWLLEIYLTRFLNTVRKRHDLFQILPITKVISFNYTNTFSLLYNSQIDVHYIHGFASFGQPEEYNNMVLGIGENIKNTTNDDKYDYIQFQKYYQRIIKKTGNDYTRWLNDREHFCIYIYGHSLDIVDADVIRKLIYCQHAKVIIFYYNQEALCSLVGNLAKILEKESLIQFTNEEKIIFIQANDIALIKEILRFQNAENMLYSLQK